MSSINAFIQSWVPFITGLSLSLVVILIARYFLLKRHGPQFAESGWIRQLLMFVITAICVMGTLLALPIGDTARGQLLSLMGILITGAIALSSTTFIGNAMAGLMLKAVQDIKPGDFLKIEEQFGRVSEQGLLHTEIQTEDRDLVTLPNLYLVTHPFRIVRYSGTIISATVSLGYDVHNATIEKVLKEAALKADLSDPFVHVTELGDYSIQYRVAGFLKEVKFLLSARSKLRVAMLDGLHEAKIEIVSPAFMNQRRLDLKTRFVPDHVEKEPEFYSFFEKDPEDLIFDKADEAESKEKLKWRLDRLHQVIKGLQEKVAQKDKNPDLERDEKKLAQLEIELKRVEDLYNK